MSDVQAIDYTLIMTIRLLTAKKNTPKKLTLWQIKLALHSEP